MKQVLGIGLFVIIFAISWAIEGLGEAICGSIVVLLGIWTARTFSNK